MNTEEMTFGKKLPVEVQALQAFENGFGFGDGGISYVERAKIVGAETVERVKAAIQSNDILVPVSRDNTGKVIEDDGCGDGRNVKRVFMGFFEKTKSLIRPKVFGGGATMVTAMEIGNGAATDKGLNQVFKDSIAIMRRSKIDFGAHTDEHAQGENCGCGAIDKAPQVIANVVRFEDEVRAAISNIGVDQTGLDDVIGNFKSYAEDVADKPYSGKEVIDDITHEGKIVKELKDNHCEMFVLLNTVEDYTVNQELIREVSNDQVQVFAVDVWRLQALAMKRYPDDPALQNQAFLSELVYTLGVSATLTKGDLPVRILSAQPATMAA